MPDRDGHTDHATVKEGPHHGRTVLVEMAVAAALETAGRRVVQRHQVKRRAQPSEHEHGPLRWLLGALLKEVTASGAAEVAWQRRRMQVALDRAAAAQSVTAASARHASSGRV